MRRGRPTKSSGDAKPTKPSSSPLRAAAGDPFKALDSNGPTPPDAGLFDDALTRFPAVDDFSILHDKESRFAFDPKSEDLSQQGQELSRRVTNALADDAFASQPNTSGVLPLSKQSQTIERPSAPITSSKPPSNLVLQKQTKYRPPSLEHEPAQKSKMISTGTMTSPPRSPTLRPQSISNRPIFRVPSSSSGHRSLSQPRKYDTPETAPSLVPTNSVSSPGLAEHRSKSQVTTADPPKSSRASLESTHRQSLLCGLDDGVHRSKSANFKSKPPSTQASSKPNILRRLSRERPQVDEPTLESGFWASATSDPSELGDEAFKIDSNVEYLKAMEEEDSSKRKEKRQEKRLSGGSKHAKRTSMPSVSLSTTKQLLAGRFGEAFRKFETNAGHERHDSSRSPTRGPSELTPIAGSEATDERSDNENALDEHEEVSPEVRRELERRRLSQEERRVADAGAAYRQRLAEGGESGPVPNSKAASIQSKVKSLLDESGRASPSPTKTASSYGRLADHQPSPDPQAQPKDKDLPVRTSSRQAPPASALRAAILQHPPRTTSKPEEQSGKPSSFTSPNRPVTMPPLPSSNSPLPQTGPSLGFQKHTGPPKPQPKPYALRTGDRPLQTPSKPFTLAARKALVQQQQQTSQPAATHVDGSPGDDWEVKFSKRYPDLSGLEMVETEIDQRNAGPVAVGKPPPLGREMRVRDV